MLPSEASRFLLASAQRQLLASLDKDETLTVSGSTRVTSVAMRPHVSPSASSTRRRHSGPHGLLRSPHVEAGNDLGYAAQVEEIPSGRVVLLRSPLLSSPAERAKVPGCCEEIAIEMPGRDRLVKRRDESLKDLIKVLREWIRDLPRVMKSCSSDIRKDV